MISFIWITLIIIGSITFILSGNVDKLNLSIITSVSDGLSLMKNILPGIIIWSGIMKIAEDSNLLKKFANILRPLLNKLFPNIPSDHPSLGYISSNIVANAFGLGSVATPFGLKAMVELSKLNNNKKIASHEMQTFLVINTAGVTLFPSMVITLRISHGSINPFIILFPSMIITVLSCLFGIFINSIWKDKKNE